MTNKTAEDFATSMDMIFQYYGLEDISDQFDSSIKKDISSAHTDFSNEHAAEARREALREAYRIVEGEDWKLAEEIEQLGENDE